MFTVTKHIYKTTKCVKSKGLNSYKLFYPTIVILATNPARKGIKRDLICKVMSSQSTLKVVKSSKKTAEQKQC